MALTTTAGSLGAANANVAVDVEQNSTFSGVVTGTFVGTVTFQALYDPTEGWVSAQTFTRPGVSAAAALTAPGNRIINTGGAIAVRAAMTAYTSGTAVVTLAGTPAASGASSGGGGGGGAVTVADGADTAEGTTTDAGIITDVPGTVIGFLRGAILRWNTYLARIPAALTGSGNFKVSVAESTASQAITAASLPLPSGAATDRTTAAAPASVELSDGAAFYTGAKTGQLPSALVSTRLDVNIGAAPASLTIGTPGAGPYPSTGFAPAAPTCTFTRPANTTAYTIGDEVGTSGTAPTTVSVARVNGGSGIIQGARAVYSNYPAVVPQLVLLVFSATVTLAGDNAQLALSDADAAKLICCIPFNVTQAVNYSAGAPVSSGALFLGGVPDRAAPHFVAGGSEQTLYCCLITLNAWTPIANGETCVVALDIEQN